MSISNPEEYKKLIPEIYQFLLNHDMLRKTSDKNKYKSIITANKAIANSKGKNLKLEYQTVNSNAKIIKDFVKDGFNAYNNSGKFDNKDEILNNLRLFDDAYKSITGESKVDILYAEEKAKEDAKQEKIRLQKLEEDNKVKDDTIKKQEQDIKSKDNEVRKHKKASAKLSNKIKQIGAIALSPDVDYKVIGTDNVSIKDYIKNKVINSSYSLSRDELKKIVEDDINNNKLPPDANPDNIINGIYSGATRYIVDNMDKIKTLSRITGYNHELYNKLPPEISELVQREINDKINEDIRKKNLKYLLPKEFTKIKNIRDYKLNPMLKRSAWSVK